MNTEQELRPCPFCGGEAVLDEFENDHIIGWFGRCLECNASMPYAISKPIAVKQWNRRSSDEQAEVVGFDTAKRAEKTILREYELGNLTALGVANHLRRAGFNLKYATDKANSLAPPAVAAGGVTEAELVALAGKTYDDVLSGKLPHINPFQAVVEAITAALAVGDEGIREGGAEPFLTGRGWENLSCDDQFALATQIAANIGYDLVPEPEHPDSPHNRAHALPTPPSRGEGV